MIVAVILPAALHKIFREDVMSKVLFLAILIVTALPLASRADDKAAAPPSFSSFRDAYAAGNEALKDRKFDDAVAAYSQAEGLASTPKGKSQAANAQGWTLLKARKLAEAKKALSRAVEEDDTNKVAQKNLGVVSYSLYEYGLAGKEELSEAVKNLEASGENPEQLELAKGDQAREQSYAEVTPEPVPDLSGMKYKQLCDLGDKLQVEGKFDSAMKVFKQAEAIAVSPESKASAANRQGKVLLDSRRPAESVSYFEQAVNYKPADKQLKVFLNSLGLSYWSLYDSGKGTAEDLKKSVDAFYKANSIDASFHTDNLKMALDELREVDPDAAKAYSVNEDKDESEDDKTDAKDGDAKDDSR